MLYYIIIFFVSLWILAFLALLLCHYIFKKKFLLKSFDDIYDNDFLIVYEVKGKEGLGNIIINKKTHEIYYNWIFLDIFQYSLTYFNDFFGPEKLEKHLYSHLDFSVTATQLHRHWSCFFDYIRQYLPYINKDYEYWKKFLISLIIFIIIMLYFSFNTQYLNDGFFFTFWCYRLGLIFLFWLVSFIIIYFFKTPNDNEWFYDDNYIKILVLYWKVANEIPIILNTLFCFSFNILCLFIIFISLDMQKLLSCTLVVYGTIVLSSLLIAIVFNKFYSYYPNSVILRLLANIKLQSIFSLPIITLVIYYIYKLIWWLNFWLSIKHEPERIFFRIYLDYLIKGYIYKNITDSAKHTVYYGILMDFLNKVYFFNNYQTKYIYIWGDAFYKESLLKREATRALRLKKKSWYKPRVS